MLIDQCLDTIKAPQLPTIREIVAALKTHLDSIQRLGQAMRKPFRHCQLTINELPTAAELMEYRQSVRLFRDSLADAQRRFFGDSSHPPLALGVELEPIIGKVRSEFANRVEEHFITEYAFLGFTSSEGSGLDARFTEGIDAVREALATLEGATETVF